MPLTTLFDLQGAAGWSAILAPFLLLFIAIVFALLDPARKSSRRADHVSGPKPGETAGGPEAPAAQAAQPRTSGPAAPPAHRPSAQVEPPPGKAASAPTASKPPVSPASAAPPVAPPPAAIEARPRLSIPQLRSQLHAAEVVFDNAAIGRTSLDLARRMIEENSPGEDIERQLRRAIVAATQFGDTAIHASARLELGDRVASRGDMTTACEHWQIARQIYWDESSTADLAEADRRMIAAGCPTDWVLNDF